MIRATSIRLFALVAGVAVVMSCDAGKPTGIGDIGPDPDNGGGSNSGDTRPPFVQIELPVANANVNIGDTIVVGVRLRDPNGVKSMEVAGLKITGNPDLGTQVITHRYQAVRADFPEGFARSDTVVFRLLRPAGTDSTADSLVLRAIATDATGLLDTAFQVVRLVRGPQIKILEPATGDSIRPGTQLNIIYSASHRSGVASVAVRIRNSAGIWPTPLVDTIVTEYGRSDVLDTVTFDVPADAPQRTGRLTIEATAIAGGFPVDAAPPVTIGISSTVAGAPMVWQTVPARAERGDSVYVHAVGGNGLTTIGLIAIAGTDTARGTPITLTGAPVEHKRWIRMELPATMQGKNVNILSFATDQQGLTGYSVAANATVPATRIEDAFRNLMLVAYGKTFPLPRTGVGGDVAIDLARGRVYVSNTVHNRIELWDNLTETFHAEGIRAGAEPWGMTLTANSNDTLLVANSGGTNISRVYIGATSPTGMTETRILTRNTVVYTLRERREEATGKIRLELGGPFSYSDRPQYVAQAKTGRIYYSTKPTTAAPSGTIRYLDATHAVPDSRQVWKYGSRAEVGTWTLFNVDSVSVEPAPADGVISDMLTICDHATGTRDVGGCASSRSGVSATIAALRAAVPTSDVEASDVDVASLGLTDTTFVAWSSNNEWIAFGEGNRGAEEGARVMMVNDTGPDYKTIFFSPSIAVADLVENASETVFGLALDSTGNMLAVHGTDSHFSAVDRVFHLRLQGRYDTPESGAGIAYHPRANIDPSQPGNEATRLAFVASQDGTIDIVDAYYYRSRGRIIVKNALYGPLRASLPMPGDSPDVILKLYGLTPAGLVVIDVTAADILPTP